MDLDKRGAQSGEAFINRNDTFTCNTSYYITLPGELRHFTRWLSKDVAVLEYFAGDVEHVPKEIRQSLEYLKERKGSELFTDLLYALVHKRYGAEEARHLWEEVVRHKYFMSQKIGRNVGIKVAALDYLDNQSGQVKDFQLLPEEELDCLLLFVNEDGLTGLYNHRYFQEELREELGRCKRYNRTFSLLFLDLDHFKEYNDQLGHMEGDILLRDLAALFKATRRDTDTVSRYGGDEFAIILPETNAKEALRFATRLFNAFKESKIGSHIPGTHKSITISMGIATYPENATTAEAIIDMADQALYRAKNAGRNCIRQAYTRATKRRRSPKS